MVPLTRSAGHAAGVAGSWFKRAVRVRSGDSPTKLQAATAITVICALALSIGGWYSIDRRETAIHDAADAAAQLIRVQDVRVLVVQADSIASNAYLQAGQESREQRAQYDDRIASASAGLVQAANAATGTDVTTLQQVSTQLSQYVGLVEQARANNRQGFPVGAAYQRQARAVAEQLLTSLRTVEQSSRTRVNDSIDRAQNAGWLLVVTSFVLLLALVLGSLWLAARWRRLVNVPIVIAGVITLLVLTVGVGVNGRAVSRASSNVRGPLTSADLLAQARAAGFDARSNEALTLIARGNGQSYETQWSASSSVVDAALDSSCAQFDRGCSARDGYATYKAAHVQERALDDQGQWERAVAAVTGTAVDPPLDFSLADPFDAFAKSAETDLVAETSITASEFDDAVASLGALRVLVVLAGLAAAALAAIGYGQRLREYR
ncbi:MAG: hypothetical protein JWN99_3442 [Ilumatobacteraceae bacterium]|nr:hypothetical protein [Ilumatobacteraceae bacterium]